MLNGTYCRWFSLGLACVLAILAGCSDPIAKGNVAGLRVGSVLGDSQDGGFAKADEPRKFIFPQDHGAHPAYRSEWWYFTSVLTDTTGREFGVQWTLFRQALSSQPLGAGPWLTGQVYMAHAAISDVRGKQHLHARRLARGHPELAGVQSDPLELWIEDWRMITVPGGDMLGLRLEAREAGQMAIALEMRQTTPILLQGDAGLSKKGLMQASYYYSMPRMRTNGELTVAGESFEVEGWTWFDREWSTSVLAQELVGWDWFALQLDDGRDLMTFKLRRRDGARDPHDYLVVRPHDSSASPAIASSASYSVVPVREWQDRYGTAWPVAWRIQLRDEHGVQETLDIDALIDDQLMDVGLRYWEGIVSVSRDGKPTGRGYMELTGYENANEKEPPTTQ